MTFNCHSCFWFRYKLQLWIRAKLIINMFVPISIHNYYSNRSERIHEYKINLRRNECLNKSNESCPHRFPRNFEGRNATSILNTINREIKIFRIIPPSRSSFPNHRPRDINPRFPSNHPIASEIIVRDVVRIGGMNAASESYGVYVHLRARRRNTRDTMQTGGGYMQSSRAREAWEWRDLLRFQSLESVLERYHLLERLSFFSLECKISFPLGARLNKSPRLRGRRS